MVANSGNKPWSLVDNVSGVDGLLRGEDWVDVQRLEGFEVGGELDPLG